MTDTTLRKSIFLDATPEQVWPWLVDPTSWGNGSTSPLPL